MSLVIPTISPVSAILIGFVYDQDEVYTKLPGIIIDLYLCYTWLIQVHGPLLPIYVVTDIVKDPQPGTYLKSIANTVVDANIISFIRDLKIRKHYFYYQDRSKLIELIAHQDAQELFFYYTGHAKDQSLLLPLNTTLTIEDLRQVFYHSRLSNIFCFLDCCEIQGLELPYQLTHTFDRHNKNYGLPQILCFAPKFSDDTLASASGSLFTTSFLKALREHQRRLIDYTKFATITATYPHILLIWSWVFVRSNLALTVCWNPVSATLEVLKINN